LRRKSLSPPTLFVGGESRRGEAWVRLNVKNDSFKNKKVEKKNIIVILFGMSVYKKRNEKKE